MLTNLYKKRYPGLLGPSINKLTAGQLLGGEKVSQNPRTRLAARARIWRHVLPPRSCPAVSFIDLGSK